MHQEEWYEYLRFSKAQQIVIIGFLLFNIALKALPYSKWYSKISHSVLETKQIENERDLANNDGIHKGNKKSNKYSKIKKNSYSRSFKENQNNKVITSDKKKSESKKDVDFKFDPNTISEDSIHLLDIPKGAKRNWIKYRNSGGQFYTAQSMSKIFGITDSDFAYLEDKIQIRSKKGVKKKKYSTAQISINKASLEDWQTIRGIGPYYAKNIIKYKESLGGFNHIHQLKEVYRLPDSTYQNMIPRLILDPFKPTYNINIMSQQALYQHPYISYKQAKIIVKYRIQHGNYKSMDDLANIISLDQTFIDKIKPYFVLNLSESQKKLSSVN